MKMNKTRKKISEAQRKELNNIAFLCKANNKNAYECEQILSAQIEIYIMNIEQTGKHTVDVGSFYEHIDTLLYMYDVVKAQNLLNM